jgi:hypothetical protein
MLSWSRSSRGCTSTRANPWWCRSSSSSGTTSPWGRRRACHASVLSLLLAPRLDPCPFRATGQVHPSYQHCCTATFSASAWLQRQLVGSPGYRAVGAVEPPHRQLTSLPGCRAVGLRPFPAPPSYLHRRTAALSASEWPRRKYPEVRLAAAVFFSDERSVCVALPFVAAPSPTLPRMRLSLCLPRLQRQRS